ncbi:MAG TPA: DUF366 family protein [Candidatus Gastranaerophilales bacterium]|nr:DUF366 family protein [Candidatus Gastranaerophilales bacterium]
MKSKFVEKEICYTGKELSPNWIYKNYHIQGDSIISFIGQCDVKIENMVDIADVLDNSPIYSKKMLHFIVEHFNIQLIEGILRQRALVGIARDVILNEGISSDLLYRKGDDLFYKDGKLSVSIAAKSINSVLIHFAMNIDSTGAPVKAAGLKTEMNLENHVKLAQNIMSLYAQECEEVINASCKVKGIF